jgi:hypothetical protein
MTFQLHSLLHILPCRGCRMKAVKGYRYWQGGGAEVSWYKRHRGSPARSRRKKRFGNGYPNVSSGPLTVSWPHLALMPGGIFGAAFRPKSKTWGMGSGWGTRSSYHATWLAENICAAEGWEIEQGSSQWRQLVRLLGRGQIEANPTSMIRRPWSLAISPRLQMQGSGPRPMVSGNTACAPPEGAGAGSKRGPHPSEMPAA